MAEDTQDVGIVVYDGYDGAQPNAYTTTRCGYRNGFTRIGLDVSLVEHRALAAFVADCNALPLLWLTYDDYVHLDDEALEAVAACPHIVQVNVWFEGMIDLHRRLGAPSPFVAPEVRARLIASAPDFVWCSAPASYVEFYQGWQDAGLRVVSLPWACDVDVYHPDDSEAFAGTQVAFVGGYRPYKEPQYANYLWPYEDELHVWGYSEWPRCYQGMLAEEDERKVYRAATVCPTISEPQFAVTGDTVERPFKVLGSGGLTVFDAVPAYTELFDAGEALIPTDTTEYDEMMEAVLHDRELNEAYRTAGRRAVLIKHTYALRAAQVLWELGR